MSHDVAMFRDVSDKSLRRTLVSCAWLSGVANSAGNGQEVVEWMERLAVLCWDERKRRKQARRYHASEVQPVRVYSDKSPGTVRRWEPSRSPVVSRDPLMAAFYGPSAGLSP